MKKKMMLFLCVCAFLFGPALTHQASETGSKAGITFSEGEPLASSEEELPDTQDSEPLEKDVTNTLPVTESTKKVLSQTMLPQTNEKLNRLAIMIGSLLILGTAILIKKREFLNE